MPKRCVLLFARDPREEGAAKRLPDATPVFAYSRRRIAAAVEAMPGVDLVAPRQRGRGFGERLANALEDARSLGYQQVVVVPADAPGLGREQLVSAFEALGTSDVVLGHASDGGVYLIGVTARVDLEHLLADVRWKSAFVAFDLLTNAPDAARLADELPDVDRRADLFALRADPGLEADLAALILVLTTRPTLPPPADARPIALNSAVLDPPGRAPPSLSPSLCR